MEVFISNSLQRKAKALKYAAHSFCDSASSAMSYLKVTIRGPKGDVERAQKLLTDLAKDKEVNLHEDTVIAKPEFHRFLIGKGGAKINKVDLRVLLGA